MPAALFKKQVVALFKNPEAVLKSLKLYLISAERLFKKRMRRLKNRKLYIKIWMVYYLYLKKKNQKKKPETLFKNPKFNQNIRNFVVPSISRMATNLT